jgi:glutamine cyclotransferase
VEISVISVICVLSVMGIKHFVTAVIGALLVAGGMMISLCGDTAADQVKRYTVKVIRTLPHNTRSFTQGLLYYQGTLYESTGLYGQSSLQRIDAQTGTVRNIVSIPDVFAEGLARWGNRLVLLTWQQQTAFIYRLSDFSQIGTFRYETEGWGLTTSDDSLIMSDGTDILYFRDPFSFETVRTITVTLRGKPLPKLNELEYIDGYIYANIWYESYIVKIDPNNGTVVGYIDATPLLQAQPTLGKDDVLNGIAYNAETGTLFLTGKNWPTIFEVTLVQGF